ncbi:MAG: hypothetical protein QG622_371 [Actinomycetota bacterium]|nr:hypothetical protein [Actinomycetota bacterium]
MFRYWRVPLVFVLLTALFTVPANAAPAETPPAGTPPAGTVPERSGGEPAPVVLLGTGGLRWDDVDETTPALAAAITQDSTAALAVRSVRDTTCPADGWLAVSAGRRAADAARPGGGCRDLSARIPAPGGPGTAGSWETYRAEAAAGRFDADPGLLGETLEAAGVPRAAVGPGALIAAADRSGVTPRTWPGLAPGPGGRLDPTADAVALAGQVRAALGSGARFVAVDLGSVTDDGTVPATDAATGEQPFTRREQVTGLGTRVGLVIDALPDQATVVFASLADDGGRPHLQVAFAYGPASQTATGNQTATGSQTAGRSGGFGPGLLRAPSTRQDGLVQSTDLLPTLVTALGLPVPEGTVGSRLARVDGGDELDRRQRLLDLDAASVEVEHVVTPFFVAYGVVELLVLGGLALLARGSRARRTVRRRALITLQVAAVTFSLVPVATFLANLWPWWRSPLPGLPLTFAVATATAALALVAFAGPWRRSLLGPAGAAGALTVGVLTADLLRGSPLQLAALIGGQPIIAGRFYGLSNPTFALFATGALLAALAVAEEILARGGSTRQAALAVAGIGVVATVIDGLPALGSDFGGPPAILPAFALLALWVAGVRVTWGRAAAIAAATAGVLVALSLADWLRPADSRSHLGHFVQSVVDGGGWLIVRRKAEQNLGILVSTPLTLAVPVVAVAAVLVLRRPERWYVPALRLAYDRQRLLPAGLASLGVMVVLGFVANDSGTSIPPVSLMLFAPLLFAVSARAVELDDAESLERAVREARRSGR